MKRLFLILLLGTSLFGFAQQNRQLTILHTSDTHSRIDPIPTSASEKAAGLGGVVRRATFLKQYRTEHPDLLLFDCGDFSQGTPYYTFFQGEVEVKMMNYMGYDAATIGNHEYDFGLENMARIFRMAQFPVVCANCDFTGTPLEGLVKPYVVLKRDGLRIGVFGLSPQLAGLVPADKYGDVIFKDPVAATQEVVRQLREVEHCDVVVCLSHMGINIKEFSDEELVAATEGIDLLLGGHTHTVMEQPQTYLNAAGENMTVLHSGDRGIGVGEVTLSLTRQE